MGPPALLQPNAVVGETYRVVRRLAAGAMGTVYVAERVDGAGGHYALKVMNPRFVLDGKTRERFAQEALVGVALRNRHVVRVFGADVDPSTGLPWMAMELLDGEDLGRALTRRGALPLAECVALFEQLGAGLAAVHQAGLVHRDLKPENVFLARAAPPAPFAVKLLDFGIAKVVHATDATGTQFIGSPLWMAPEQVTDGGRVRPATDVWPLALMAFLALTGKHYWRAANDDGAIIDLVMEVRAGATDRASTRAAQLGAGALPTGFDRWFARCLKVDPTARFPTGGAATAALLDVLKGRAARRAAWARGALWATAVAASVALATLLAHHR